MTKTSLGFAILLCLFGCQSKEQFQVSLTPSKEEKTANGKPYTPGTQSFLRGHHWMETIKTANFTIEDDMTADINFKTKDGDKNFLSAKNLPLDQLVPRLHYKVQGEPDGFDYFNLMLAEYSRNGLSYPFAKQGDEITHFETNLQPDIPWKLAGDYEFTPNPDFKPIRVSLVNNCLSSGLWEMNASDKTGEIWHSWFDFPSDKYYQLVADVNGLEVGATKKALEWKSEGVIVDLDRLRTVKKTLGTTAASPVNDEISYSSQDSRRKLGKGFVQCERAPNQYDRPYNLEDMITHKVKMAKFVKPGIYAQKDKMEFDFSYLGQPQKVTVREVDPKTAFDFDRATFERDDLTYIEIEIDLPNKRKLIVGNLPLNLLAQKEDFAIHGFGVGILSSSDFAERRQFLISQGFHPSYAYFVQETPDGLLALNSHDEGLEQIFIRSFATADTPHWDVTFTSYERITDIVKYRIPIVESLIPQQVAHHEEYITPVYFSYRDDNLR